MSKNFRDYLLWVFIIVFIILTLIISLYASGYKFNLSWPLKFNRLLQKTGMLTVATKPTGAAILLNGEHQKNSSFQIFSREYATTPKKIKNILPGEYNLRLELDGYWPFEKRITILPGQTTFVEDINLFLNSQPTNILVSEFSPLSISPGFRYLYLEDYKQIINLKTDKTENLAAASNTNNVWLSDAKLLSDGLIYNADKNSSLDYNKIIGAGAELWQYDKSNNTLYYKNQNSLNRLEADGKTNTFIVSGENYLSYEARGEHLFFISSNQGKIWLQDYSFKTKQVEKKRELPSVANYQFIFDGRPTLSLYDSQNKTLYLVDPNDINSYKTINNIVSWDWSSDTSLFYNNDWEIYAFGLQPNKSWLITRVGEKINKVMWSQRLNYLLFASDQSLTIVDLKNITLTTIWQAEKIGLPVLDDDSGTLYLWAKTASSSGIFKMIMQ